MKTLSFRAFLSAKASNPFLSAFLFCSVILAASSALSSQIKSEIRHKSRDLGKVTDELNRKREEKERLKREAEQLSQQMKRAESEVRNVEQALIHTRTRTGEVERNMAKTKNLHDGLINNIQKSQGALHKSFGSYYVASVLVDAYAPEIVFQRQLFAGHSGVLRSLKSQKELTTGQLNDLIETQKILRREFYSQESKLKEIQTDMVDKSRLLNKKMTRQDILEAELKDLERTKEELAALIEILRTRAKKEEESEKKARLEKQRSGSSPIPLHSLSWPVKGKVKSRFGRQTHSSLGTPFFSNGILIVLPQSDSVKVVSDGRVLYAGKFMSYGSMVLVEHAGDWYSVYGQLGRWTVEKGQALKKGDEIGWAGDAETGGAQLYFELRFYGKPTDPMPWLSFEDVDLNP